MAFSLKTFLASSRQLRVEARSKQSKPSVVIEEQDRKSKQSKPSAENEEQDHGFADQF